MKTRILICGTLVALCVQSIGGQETDELSKRDALKQKSTQTQANDRQVEMLLNKFDKNKDGVLEENEVPAAIKRRFASIDSNKDGKLTKSELQKVRSRSSGRRSGEIITGPARGERFPDKLKVGDPAPDFKLADPSGKRVVTLSDSQGKRPVVLIFGSYT